MPCVNELVGAVARQEPSVVVLHALYRRKSVQSCPVNELSPVEQRSAVRRPYLDFGSVRKVGDCGYLRNPLPYIGEQVTEIIREGQMFLRIMMRLIMGSWIVLSLYQKKSDNCHSSSFLLKNVLFALLYHRFLSFFINSLASLIRDSFDIVTLWWYSIPNFHTF